jgi:8-oxo-dGTP pyrophosphatase MutT (NUDIX family)
MILTPNEIKKKLSKPLPGVASHLKLAPKARVSELINFNGNETNAKKSAVMILLYQEGDELKVIFIKRGMYVGIHAGQIAFPGGKYEDSDINLENTALREVEEEIGIPASEIEVLGRLTDIYVSKSNFIISTFVGFLKQKPFFVKSEREVAEIYEIDLKLFFEDNIIFEKDFIVPSSQSSVRALYYKIENIDIWGASAMVMTEFIDIFSHTKHVN